MKSVPYCLLLLAASVSAQTRSEIPPIRRLTSTLVLLKDATSVSTIRQQVVDDIMSVAPKGPQSSTVGEFAYHLTNALVGRDLPVTAISQISESIIDALRGAAPRDFSFFASLDHLRKALIGLGVIESEAQTVVDSLMDVGFEAGGRQRLFHLGYPFGPLPARPSKP